MNDPEGVAFLQWCLPRLGLRWPGFRKVRRRVYTRVDRRLKELGLPGVAAYRTYLDGHPEEWPLLDTLCRIPISRFYRDRAVFDYLAQEVLPGLARLAGATGGGELRAWSVGCASGEEPYTLAIVWHERCAPRFPALRLRIVATDVDLDGLARARRGCYQRSSLKDLPAELRERAFSASGGELCVKPHYRSGIVFEEQDVRAAAPRARVHLVLCRNLAFTYFDETVQREVVRRLEDRLIPGGALVVGRGESLPAGTGGFEPWSPGLGVYRRAHRSPANPMRPPSGDCCSPPGARLEASADGDAGARAPQWGGGAAAAARADGGRAGRGPSMGSIVQRYFPV